MYRIAICDDEEYFREYMKKVIVNAEGADSDLQFEFYSSGEQLLDTEKEHLLQIDLLILDMQLSGMDGYRTAENFRKINNNAVLIFCSGVVLPSVEAFYAQPYRYLLKAYTEERMQIEMKEVLKKVKETQREPIIEGKYRNGRLYIRARDVLYIDIVKRGCQIHINPVKAILDVDERVLIPQKLPEVHERLKEYGFVYAHNSYIINVNYIKKIQGENVILSNDECLKISKSRYREFKEQFTKYMGQKY